MEKLIFKLMKRLSKASSLAIFMATICSALHAQNVVRNVSLRAAQLISKVEVSYGPSVTTQRGFDKIGKNTETKPGYVLTGSLVHTMSRRFEIAAKILWEEKGSKNTESVFLPPYTAYNQPTNQPPSVPSTVGSDYNYYYLSFSLMPRYLFGKQKRFHIGAGPYYSSLRTSRFIYTVIQNGQIEFGQQVQPDSFAKKYDAGVSVSFGYSIPLYKIVSLNMSLMDNYGLANISASPATSIKNDAFSFLVGLTFSRTHAR